MDNIKNLLNKFIITVIISLIFLYTVNVNFAIYFAVVFLIGSLLLLNYCMKTNLEFFDILIIVGLGNFLAYLINEIDAKYIADIWIFSFIILYFFGLLSLSILSHRIYLSRSKETEKRQELM